MTLIEKLNRLDWYRLTDGKMVEGADSDTAYVKWSDIEAVINNTDDTESEEERIDALVYALKRIKVECEKHRYVRKNGCENCPLSDGCNCLVIKSIPEQWNIETKEYIKILN